MLRCVCQPHTSSLFPCPIVYRVDLGSLRLPYAQRAPVPAAGLVAGFHLHPSSKLHAMMHQPYHDTASNLISPASRTLLFAYLLCCAASAQSHASGIHVPCQCIRHGLETHTPTTIFSRPQAFNLSSSHVPVPCIYLEHTSNPTPGPADLWATRAYLLLVA